MKQHIFPNLLGPISLTVTILVLINVTCCFQLREAAGVPAALVVEATFSRGDAENIDQPSRRTHHSFGMVCVHSTGIGTVRLFAVLSMAYDAGVD